MSKKKIAVLGGGIGSLSAAIGITNKPGWQEEYEITVYQMGWRLGGKCASGRRPPYDRIEEHGLHIWIGFYDNAFRMIQAAYSELDRPPSCPVRTWQDALKPHNFVVLEEFFKGKWYHIPINFPTNNLVPGDSNPHPDLAQYVTMALKAVHSFLSGHMRAREIHTDGKPDHPFLRLVGKLFKLPVEFAEGAVLGTLGLLVAALDIMPLNLVAESPEHKDKIGELLTSVVTAMRNELYHLIENDAELRHAFQAVDIVMAVIRGLIEDHVFSDPNLLDCLDNIEFRAWLMKHGAEESSAHSGFIRALYDLAFGYVDGDVDQPDMAQRFNLLEDASRNGRYCHCANVRNFKEAGRQIPIL
jgi:uncharacterized protein with NAD-binding domain and iron-sulfur cluster